MNKLVYLFELDSVRKYENTRGKGVLYTPGVKGLYTEIVKKGNSVAISMNQLTDSQLIREALGDDEAFSCLMKLFGAGVLRLSLYGNIRTASQYVQQSVEKCLRSKKDRFVFSNMPIRSRDKVRLEEVRDALRFSDLSVLKERVERASDEEQSEMKLVYRFVDLILQLSVCETGNITPKQGEKRSFLQFLSQILEELSVPDTFDGEFSQRLENAISIIHRRGAAMEEEIRICKDPEECPNPENRSDWRNKEKDLASDERLANEIIDLCYNYVVEDSINGVTKHYGGENSFRADLLSRVRQYCMSEKEEKCSAVSRGRWHTLVRFATYKEREKKCAFRYEPSVVYEKDANKEKWLWKGFLLWNNFTSFLLALSYTAIFVLVNLALSFLEGFSPLSWENLLLVALGNVVLFGILGAIIDLGLKLLNRGKEVPDILDSIVDTVIHTVDFWRAWGGKDDSYSVHR